MNAIFCIIFHTEFHHWIFLALPHNLANNSQSKTLQINSSKFKFPQWRREEASQRKSFGFHFIFFPVHDNKWICAVLHWWQSSPDGNYIENTFTIFSSSTRSHFSSRPWWLSFPPSSCVFFIRYSSFFVLRSLSGFRMIADVSTESIARWVWVYGSFEYFSYIYVYTRAACIMDWI